MVFLETILIILLCYLGLKILWRLLKPTILRYVSKKINNRFEKAFGQSPFQQPSSHQGNKQQKKTNTIPKEKKKVGEYIDFEEIE